MAINFPTNLDDLANVATGNTITPAHKNDLNDIVEVLEAKVGVDSSTVVTSHDYKFTHLPAQAQNFDIGTYDLRGQTVTADKATGIPLIITSTTACTNLNADMVDGKHVAGTNGAGEITTNDGTQTLTSKTLTSPTLTTPVLGTPSSGTLTSCTGLPLTTGVIGTLAVGNGGTGATAAANAASGVVILDANAKLPAVDGSQLTALATAGRPGTLTAGTPCVQNPFVIKTKTTQAHGLGAIPTLVDVYFECLSAEAGYGVGDRVMAIVEDSQNAGSMARWDATNVYILSSNNAPYILNGTTPEGITVLTAAKWKVVAVPYKLN